MNHSPSGSLFLSKAIPGFINYKTAEGLALLAIGFYTLLVGAGASVVRAVIMGVLSLSVVQLGRRQDGRRILPQMCLRRWRATPC